MTIIERAFTLAESGECQSLVEMEKQLKREGYSSVAEHLRSGALRKQLKAILATRSKADGVAKLAGANSGDASGSEILAAE
jgi:hypothetical protein